MNTLPFDGLVGHDRVKAYLGRLLQSGALPNLLLFTGPEGVGKSLFAERFARLLLQESKNSALSPDLFQFFPEGKIGLYSIETIRELISQIFERPNSGKKRLFILHSAERMLPDGANALLKSFEEPLLSSVVILLSSKKEELLPTIRSRAQEVRFGSLKEDEFTAFLKARYGVDEERAKDHYSRSFGSMGRALELEKRQGKEEELKHFLHLLKEPDPFYPELLKTVEALAKRVEEERERLLKEASLEPKEATPLLTAKKLRLSEGMVHLSYLNSVKELLLQIFISCRDRMVATLEGEGGGITPLAFEKTAFQMTQALKLVESSTPLAHVLESLFIKIHSLTKVELL